MDRDRLSFYKSGLRRQWRWRYQSAGNGAKLANGGESYGDLRECVQSALRVCGMVNESVSADVSQVVVRKDGLEVFVSFP